MISYYSTDLNDFKKDTYITERERGSHALLKMFVGLITTYLKASGKFRFQVFL